jgi:hypothetical protein
MAYGLVHSLSVIPIEIGLAEDADVGSLGQVLLKDPVGSLMPTGLNSLVGRMASASSIRPQTRRIGMRREKSWI